MKTDENRDDTGWRIVTLSILFQMGREFFSLFFFFFLILLETFRFCEISSDFADEFGIWAPMIRWIFCFLILDLRGELFFFLKAIRNSFVVFGKFSRFSVILEIYKSRWSVNNDYSRFQRCPNC